MRSGTEKTRRGPVAAGAAGLGPEKRRPAVRLAVGLAGLLFWAGAIGGLSGCAARAPLDLPAEYASPPADARPWSDLAAVRADDWYTLLNTGREGLAWRLRAIDTATRSIDLQTFLWKPDPTGRAIMRRILRAAGRGVRVRFLVDDTFTVNEGHLLYRLDRHPNIAVRIYNPFNRCYNSFVLRELMNLGEFARLDHRMHNKALVVDNRAAIIGGRNLADEYFGYHGEFNFRDMELLAVGSAASAISDRFDAYWNSGWSFPVARIIKKQTGEDDPKILLPIDAPDGALGPMEAHAVRHDRWIAAAQGALTGEAALIADAPAHRDPAAADEVPNQLSRALIAWIEGAREELVIVSAYLIPTTELEAAVERAEKRGVRVRMLTNSLRSNNHTAAHAIYRRHVVRIMAHGADLHEVRARAKDRALYMQAPVDNKRLGLHAKLLLVDREISFIGSPNLDPRSLHLNTEIGILVRSRELNRLIRRALAIDFSRRNAWQLQAAPSGAHVWVGDDAVLTEQPAASWFQRLEDWFLGLLPIEDEM